MTTSISNVLIYESRPERKRWWRYHGLDTTFMALFWAVISILICLMLFCSRDDDDDLALVRWNIFSSLVTSSCCLTVNWIKQFATGLWMNIKCMVMLLHIRESTLDLPGKSFLLFLIYLLYPGRKDACWHTKEFNYGCITSCDCSMTFVIKSDDHTACRQSMHPWKVLHNEVLSWRVGLPESWQTTTRHTRA